jgi:hypothetical protein
MSDPSTVIVATDPATLRKIADEAFTAFNSGGRHVQSFSARYPGFTLDDAYRVTASQTNCASRTATSRWAVRPVSPIARCGKNTA